MPEGDLEEPLLTNTAAAGPNRPLERNDSEAGPPPAPQTAARVVYEGPVHFSPYLFGALLLTVPILWYETRQLWRFDQIMRENGVERYSPVYVQTVQSMLYTNTIILPTLALVLLLIVPRRLTLYSDARLVVTSLLYLRFTFGNLRSAARNASHCDTVKRLRWDFATDLKCRLQAPRRVGSGLLPGRPRRLLSRRRRGGGPFGRARVTHHCY